MKGEKVQKMKKDHRKKGKGKETFFLLHLSLTHSLSLCHDLPYRQLLISHVLYVYLSPNETNIESMCFLFMNIFYSFVIIVVLDSVESYTFF